MLQSPLHTILRTVFTLLASTSPPPKPRDEIPMGLRVQGCSGRGDGWMDNRSQVQWPPAAASVPRAGLPLWNINRCAQARSG